MSDALDHLVRVTRAALALASRDFLSDVSDRLRDVGVQDGIAKGDGTPVVDYILRLLPLQGISDQAAFAFDDRHGGIRTDKIKPGLNSAACPLLRCYWSFQGCGYRKTRRTCAASKLLHDCSLPRHALRKGGLNVASYGLHLFVRDICQGDLVAWIDARLASADPGRQHSDRPMRMRDALIVPLSYIPNTGPKLWNMILADLLLVGDPSRERWVITGAAMIAIDSLMHNFLHRTGALRRCGAEHPYGEACYQSNGCADIITALAEEIDARKFNPAFPEVFPRFVQHAIWQFCATGERNICNGTRVNGRGRCQQQTCPVFPLCDRVGAG